MLVAALTGANILEGIATPAPFGSVVQLNGGGELRSAMSARGEVHVAVHPWAFELSDTRTSPLVDTVLSVGRDRGSFVVRLSRFTVRVPLNGREPVAEGSVVGLRASPQYVRVLDAAAPQDSSWLPATSSAPPPAEIGE